MNEEEIKNERREELGNDGMKNSNRMHYDRRVEDSRRMGLGIAGGLILLIIVFLLGRASSNEFGHYRGYQGGTKYGEFGEMMNGRGGGMMNDDWGGGMMGRGGMMNGYNGGNYGNSRLSGEVSAINGDVITVKDSSGTEYKVNVSDTTSYRNSQGIAKHADLKSGNSVMVYGSSNSNGEINATLVVIR